MPSNAHDHFDRYYAEKLWAMVPEYYRELDGDATPPGVLRGFIEVLAQQAATLRRSNDRLWDDQFIDLCSDWAVPYIGELVGTRMLPPLLRRGRRIDVAKTIYYRRRAGTPRVLEELIVDITGWEGKLVEEFKLLGRARHGLDPLPERFPGALTGTLPGGWADMRSAHGAELVGSPFDEFHHTPDFRRPDPRGANTDGRYGIAKLGFHIYRLTSTKLEGVTPCSITPTNNNPDYPTNYKAYTFDPSGRDVPLFAKRSRATDRGIVDWESWMSAKEWEVPAPIPCRLLSQSDFMLSDAALKLITGLTTIVLDKLIAELQPYIGVKIRGESMLREVFLIAYAAAGGASGWLESTFQQVLQLIVADCGKGTLLPGGGTSAIVDSASIVVGTAAGIVARERIAAGNLFEATVGIWPTFPLVTNKDWIVDPVHGRLLSLKGTGAKDVNYHYGFSDKIGAGGYDRQASIINVTTDTIKGGGTIQATLSTSPNYLPEGSIDTQYIITGSVAEIKDSATYDKIPDRLDIVQLELRAANLQRPYLRLGADWTLHGKLAYAPLVGPVQETTYKGAPNLTLNGLWIGAKAAASIVITGDFKTVTLRHVTIDPGCTKTGLRQIPSVTLEIQGKVDELIIERSIVGKIIATGANGLVENLRIRDSIVDGLKPATQLFSLGNCKVTLERTTVFGSIACEWLYATETIITGTATVTNTQEGCFRFSACGEFSRVPHPYESHFVGPFALASKATRANPDWLKSHFIGDFRSDFTSKLFGHPGYAQLTAIAPEFLLRGAQNGSEIGAFCGLMNPIKFDALKAKIDEYAPFGLLPVFIFET